jgi:GNAT superfamily N-acetyltransferase
MVRTFLHYRFAAPQHRAHSDESAPDPPEFRVLRANRRADIPLFVRAARPSDGEALQTYVRALSQESRYNRFLGAANELPASELARALAANDRDMLTLLLTSVAEDGEAIVGEARVALWCADRAGEFGMSIADHWRRLGAGSALLQEIERRAAAEGIELLYGDTLRTNEAMITLAHSHDFSVGPGFEGRLVQVRKRLEDAAPDLPCRKWTEIAGGAELRTA